MALPTNESLQKTQRNMDSIDEFISSDQPTLDDQYGGVRKTLTGVEEDANNQLADQEQEFQNRFAPSTTILPWEPLTLIESALQRYSTGTIGESGYKEWLADPAKVPFTTSATFPEDEALGRWGNALTATQDWVKESVSFASEYSTLTDGQLDVTFINEKCLKAKFSVHGDNINNGELGEDDIITIDSTNVVLSSSYPAGTKLKMSWVSHSLI